MKKYLITTLLLLSSIASASLWNYYGGNVPPLSDRAKIYKNISSDKYVGSAEQNNKLESYLNKKLGSGGATITQPPNPATQGTGGSNVFTYGVDSNTNNNYVISAGSDLTTPFLSITTAGNVGIGTTSPLGLLSVQGASSGTSNLLVIASTTASYASTTVLKISSGGLISLPFDSTAAPHIACGNTTVSDFCLSAGAGRAIIGYDAGGTNFVGGGLMLEGGTAKNVGISAGKTNSIFTTNIVPDLFVSGGSGGAGALGFVGVGTSSPTTRLHITSGANATTTVTIGSLGLNTSKGCININTATGAPASIYIGAAGTLVTELFYCQ